VATIAGPNPLQQDHIGLAIVVKREQARRPPAPFSSWLSEDAMSNVFEYYFVPVALGAVAFVLLLGLANMLRGGSPNTSQRLMRLRVLLQFIAVVVVMATLWMMQR
jgi:hypothetical protein